MMSNVLIPSVLVAESCWMALAISAKILLNASPGKSLIVYPMRLKNWKSFLMKLKPEVDLA